MGITNATQGSARSKEIVHENTWEDNVVINKVFPKFHLEDKVKLVGVYRKREKRSKVGGVKISSGPGDDVDLLVHEGKGGQQLYLLRILLLTKLSPSRSRPTPSRLGQASRPNSLSRCSPIRSGPKALSTSASQLKGHLSSCSTATSSLEKLVAQVTQG
ncbi:hypothetical protein CR513_16980, partial [Mucuna pruriens]